MRWSLKDFLSALYENRRLRKMRVAWRQLLDFAYVDLPPHQCFDKLMGPKEEMQLSQETALLSGGGPLRQHMWKPEENLLSAERLARKLGPSELNTKIRRYHIESAIKALYLKPPEDVTFPWEFNMAITNKLKQHKTRYLPLKPVMKDESTTSNNIRIIEDIWTRQFQVKDDDPAFASILHLVGGDLKTWSRIQSAKKLRSEILERPFDRFDWLVPSLGLWHLRLNMPQLIHRIHWGEINPADPSALQYAADRWNRSRVVQPNDFLALEELIIHSHQARIVGVWIKRLRREKQDPKRVKEAIPWLEAQSSVSWQATVNGISDTIHAPLPTAAPETQAPVHDQQFHNHQKYCSHVEIYLTLRYAIKHADIGLLRHALLNTAVVFQAAAAGTPKYAHALLYTLHLVATPAPTLDLQNCILESGLVNLGGAEDTNFELDRLLELLNNSLKVFQQERSYYSKNSDTLLEHWAINGPYLLDLKSAVESSLGSQDQGDTRSNRPFKMFGVWR
ncbi:MAG: hypothetical protein MMC33_006183 [Icmadophila ericetorum]|nr:hypothetical protein [Icmadophila ericetorum]